MKDSAAVNSVGESRIRLEISGSKLRQLLNCGALCVADFRVLTRFPKSVYGGYALEPAPNRA